jgi:hypothetical protein
MGRWVGWGIVTANLAKIAERPVARRAAKERRHADAAGGTKSPTSWGRAEREAADAPSG